MEIERGHLEKYSLEAGRSAIEVAAVSVFGLMGAAFHRGYLKPLPAQSGDDLVNPLTRAGAT